MSEEARDIGIKGREGVEEKGKNEQVIEGVNGGGKARVINRPGHGEEIDPRFVRRQGSWGQVISVAMALFTDLWRLSRALTCTRCFFFVVALNMRDRGLLFNCPWEEISSVC